jgi:hypothetical protein
MKHAMPDAGQPENPVATPTPQDPQSSPRRTLPDVAVFRFVQPLPLAIGHTNAAAPAEEVVTVRISHALATKAAASSDSVFADRRQVLLDHVVSSGATFPATDDEQQLQKVMSTLAELAVRGDENALRSTLDVIPNSVVEYLGDEALLARIADILFADRLVGGTSRKRGEALENVVRGMQIAQRRAESTAALMKLGRAPVRLDGHPTHAIPFTSSERVVDRRGQRLISNIGIGDLLVVRQGPARYEMAEIAHIENVMASEKRERIHDEKRLTEQTIAFETETVREEEQDLQREQRDELQKESQKTISRDMGFEASVGVTASYGFVNADVQAAFSYASSSQNQESEAKRKAQQIISRTIERMRETTRTQRITRILHEIRERNLHSFDNTRNIEHVIGEYRWLEQIHDMQVMRYDRRLLFEFMVPDPAALVRHFAKGRVDASAPEPPSPPRTLVSCGITKAADVENDTSRSEAVSALRATGIKPKPQGSRIISAPALHSTSASQALQTVIVIPDGYVAKEWRCSYTVEYYADNSSSDFNKWKLEVSVGGQLRTFGPSVANAPNVSDSGSEGWDARGEEGSVTISVKGTKTVIYTVECSVECRPDAALAEWQLETYERLLEAEQALRNVYEQQLAASQAQKVMDEEGDLPGKDSPPLRNRMIEREELKRGCLELLMRKHLDKDEDLRTITSVDGTPPRINFAKVGSIAPMVQFLEQAFEWVNMGYVFYPYFWSDGGSWKERTGVQHPDPLFDTFLRAGFARVILPVRPAAVQALMYYLLTDLPWLGEDAPAPGDDLYLNLVEEIRSQTEPPENEEAVGEPWTIRLPTTLVMLRSQPTITQ